MHRAPDAQGMQDSTISVEAVRDSNFDLIRVDPVQSSTANRSQNYLQPIPRHQNSQNSRSSDHIPFPDSGHLRLGQPDVRTNAAQQASDSEMPHTQASAAIPVRDQWIASHNADQQESMGNNVLSAADSAVNTGQMNGVFALDEGDWMTLVITRTLDAMGLERMPIPETTNSASSSQLATAIPMDEPIAALPEAHRLILIIKQDMSFCAIGQ
jgi:hypothetical protein